MLVNYKKVALIALSNVIIGLSLNAIGKFSADRKIIISGIKRTNKSKSHQETDIPKHVLVQRSHPEECDESIITRTIINQLEQVCTTKCPELKTYQNLAAHVIYSKRYLNLRTKLESVYLQELTQTNKAEQDPIDPKKLVLAPDTAAELVDTMICAPVSKKLEKVTINFIADALNLTTKRKQALMFKIRHTRVARQKKDKNSNFVIMSESDSLGIISCLTDVEKINLLSYLAQESQTNKQLFNKNVAVNKKAIITQKKLDEIEALAPILQIQIPIEFSKIEEMVDEYGTGATSIKHNAEKTAYSQRVKWFIGSLLGAATMAYFAYTQEKLLSYAAATVSYLCAVHGIRTGFSFYHDPEIEHYNPKAMSDLFGKAYRIITCEIEAKEDNSNSTGVRLKESPQNKQDDPNDVPDLVDAQEESEIDTDSVGSDF